MRRTLSVNRPPGQIMADLPVKLIRIDRSFCGGYVGQIEADWAVILERIGQSRTIAAEDALRCIREELSLDLQLTQKRMIKYIVIKYKH